MVEFSAQAICRWLLLGGGRAKKKISALLDISMTFDYAVPLGSERSIPPASSHSPCGHRTARDGVRRLTTSRISFGACCGHALTMPRTSPQTLPSVWVLGGSSCGKSARMSRRSRGCLGYSCFNAGTVLLHTESSVDRNIFPKFGTF